MLFCNINSKHSVVRFNLHFVSVKLQCKNFYRTMLAQSVVMRLHVVRLSVRPSVRDV